jgi:hypothetical protein
MRMMKMEGMATKNGMFKNELIKKTVFDHFPRAVVQFDAIVADVHVCSNIH